MSEHELLITQPKEHALAMPISEVEAENHLPFDVFLKQAKDDPTGLISNSELAPLATTFHVETIAEFHKTLGHNVFPEEGILGNKQRREDEINNAFNKLSGTDSKLDTSERLKLQQYLATVIQSAIKIWDELKEDARDRVKQAVEAIRQGRGGIIFDRAALQATNP